MRILLSKSSRLKLLKYLKNKYNCSSIQMLSYKIKIPKSTLEKWFYYKDRYLPDKIIPNEIKDKLEILDKQKDNWGRIKGGKETYKIIVKKYGIDEIRKRQSKGGKISSLKRHKMIELNLDILNPLFLEFYGVLLGDGWIGEYKHKGKITKIIGISGHISLDRDFLLYCRGNIKKLFDRDGYLKIKQRYNSIELQFGHRELFRELNKNLRFPIGKKVNLRINKHIYSHGYNKVRHIIRGIFDTDGSFYLDKTSSGNPYPCISINMKAPILIKQLYKILLQNGFKVGYRKERNMITLKGKKQIDKWMEEIGSNNPKHYIKYKNWLDNVPVAQLGLERLTAGRTS